MKIYRPLPHLAVPCPFCEARVGVPCDEHGREPTVPTVSDRHVAWVHVKRLIASEEQAGLLRPPSGKANAIRGQSL